MRVANVLHVFTLSLVFNTLGYFHSTKTPTINWDLLSQPLPLSSEPATAVSALSSIPALRCDKYTALHESMKKEMENKMKCFSKRKVSLI